MADRRSRRNARRAMADDGGKKQKAPSGGTAGGDKMCKASSSPDDCSARKARGRPVYQPIRDMLVRRARASLQAQAEGRKCRYRTRP